ncbi:MAG: GGDEF domain-containing protein [Phycisphaerales bacterium]|nr:GGDEF domain-containing protein [Phycisphaerales bacterium]
MSGGASMRVIVVGRTGLETSLRRDDGIELIRAGNVLDAIGELNDPIDRNSPAQAVVIIGPESEPELVGLTTHGLVSALREIDPRVRVLGVARAETASRGGPPPLPQVGGSVSALDGRVSTACDGNELRELVLRQSVARAAVAPQSVPSPAAPAATAPQHIASASASAVAPAPVESRITAPEINTGAAAPVARALSADGYAAWLNAEAALLRAVHEGRPIRPMLMARVRELLGPDATLDEAPGATGGEIVACDGRIFGVLKSSAASVPGSQSLVRAICGWLGAILASQEHCERLAREATTDELTGAFNRRYFERYVAQAAEHAKRTRASFCVLLLDADNFKYYNDKYGHGAGDEILIELVRLLTSTIRPNDRVCRIGGDELAIVLFDREGPRTPGSQPLASAWQVVRRFQQRVSDHAFPKLSANAPGKLTVSGGLATFPWDGLTSADLLHAADERLLQAKREGKDRIVMGEKG